MPISAKRCSIMEVKKMAQPLIRIVKSAKGKGSHPESRRTSEVTAPPPSSLKGAERSVKEPEERKDKDAFCVPWYLP